MSITTLLADPAAIRLECIRPSLSSITLIVKTTSPQALCPRCAIASTRLHSHYTRTVADLPWHGVAIKLQLHTRRFFCSTMDCPQRIFCERLPKVVARYARRTARLTDALRLIGFALGGEAGARAARELGMSLSPDTLLRRIRQAALPTYPLPRVLGVDDWALCRGQRYGTILVDLERHRRIDLLPDRQAATLCAWLRLHPGVEIISRDRAPAYAEGASEGAPQAVQVADRWHLLKNLSETLERLITRKHRFVHQAAQAVIVPLRSLAVEEKSQETPVVADTPLTRAGREIAERRDRRLACYTEAMELRRQRVSARVIARTVGVCTRTIRRWVRAESFPERIAAKRQSILDAFMPDLKRRWEEGCYNASQLWRELSLQGFNGSSQIVRYHVARWRAQLPPNLRYTRGPLPNSQPQAMTPPAPRRVGWLLLKKDEGLKVEEQAFIAKLCSLCSEMEAARILAQEFSRMVRHRQVEALAGWLDEAQRSSLPEFQSFATGLQRDRQAVEAALSCEWSNGQVEGQVNRLKLIKRQMYGRANFDLLRARVLHAA